MGKQAGAIVNLNPSGMKRLNETLEEQASFIRQANVSNAASISTKSLRFQGLGELIVNEAPLLVRHRLGVKPTQINIQPKGSARVWVTGDTTKTGFHLKADADGARCVVSVSA